MVVIYDNNALWIEVFDRARLLLAAGASRTDDFNFAKPGRILVALCTLDKPNDASDLVFGIRRQDDAEIVYGQALTGVRVRITEVGGAIPSTVGEHVMVFLGR